MPDFRPLSDEARKALRLLDATRLLLRRCELRLASNEGRVRLAGALTRLRPARTVTDLRWHAQLTRRQAEALEELADGLKARRAFVRTVGAAAAQLDSATRP
jgi:hypothetical protein